MSRKLWLKQVIFIVLTLIGIIGLILMLRFCSKIKPPTPEKEPIQMKQEPSKPNETPLQKAPLLTPPAPSVSVLPPISTPPPVSITPPTIPHKPEQNKKPLPLQKPVKSNSVATCKSIYRIVSPWSIDFTNCKGQRYCCNSMAVGNEGVIIPPPENDDPGCFEKRFDEELHEPLLHTCCPDPNGCHF